MAGEVERALLDIREQLLSNPVSPRVETPREINRHYCQYVARRVADRVGDQVEVRILEDGGYGFAHTWIASDCRHYDVERPEGVNDHRELPFFQRHPEAAFHVEPGTADRSRIRNRSAKSPYI